jgi:polyisoprenoid-binding protein YceI
VLFSDLSSCDGPLVYATVEETTTSRHLREGDFPRAYRSTGDILRTSNFLEVDKYPTMTFKSTKIEQTGPDTYNMTGDLTIKGNTRPVTLAVKKYGESNDPMMGHRIAYGAEGKINRKDFGLSFNMMLDGRLIVSEEIQIFIEGEFVEQKQEGASA